MKGFGKTESLLNLIVPRFVQASPLSVYSYSFGTQLVQSEKIFPAPWLVKSSRITRNENVVLREKVRKFYRV